MTSSARWPGIPTRQAQLLALPRRDPFVQVNNHEQRITDLENAINDNTMPPHTAPAGPWDAQLFAVKWYAHYDYTVTAASLTLGASGDCDGSFWVDGVQLWTVSISGSDRGRLPILDGVIAAGSVVQVSLDTDGVSDIVWQLAMYRTS